MDKSFNLRLGFFVVTAFQTYCNNWIQVVIFHKCSLIIQSHQWWFNWPNEMGSLLSLQNSTCHSKMHSHLSGRSDTLWHLPSGTLNTISGSTQISFVSSSLGNHQIVIKIIVRDPQKARYFCLASRHKRVCCVKMGKNEIQQKKKS